MTILRRLCVFDCFGTVVFTPGGRPDHRRAVAAFLDEFECDEAAAKAFVLPLLAHAWLPNTPSLKVVDHVNAIADRLSLDSSRLNDFIWRSFGPGDSEWRAPIGVRQTLAALCVAEVELRMMTNCVLAPAQMRRMLNDLKVGHYFSALMFSSDGQGKKPEQAWFAEAFAGDFDEVVMIGDSEVFDIAPARAFGARTVLVSGSEDWINPQDLRILGIPEFRDAVTPSFKEEA